MQTSDCKDLVVWKPPPLCEVILDTRASYRAYVMGLQQALGFDYNYDYIHHMAELGDVITQTLCRRDEFSKSLVLVGKHHRAMIPAHIEDKDEITLMGLKFQALATDVFNRAIQMRLYNEQGYLPFFFKNWVGGCLMLGHMSY